MGITSPKPLSQKLGIKDGLFVEFINTPSEYFDWIQRDSFKLTELTSKSNNSRDFIHFFPLDLQDLEQRINRIKSTIVSNGMIWVSWPKKSSKVYTNINENLIREIAIANGLVDVKVCSINEVYSALKLVIPIKMRSKK